MPIGKNAIKRVSNNGYSKVKAEAPDMENSEVIAEKIEVAEKKKSAPKKSASAKSASKATPKKSLEKEPDLSPVKTAEKVTKKPVDAPKRQGDGYINLGGELPYYLL